MNGKTNIIVGQHAGFCFGVKRAVDQVRNLTEQNHDGVIYTVGELIHNPQIISELEKKGVRVISDTDINSVLNDAENGKSVTLVIRTHGVTREISDKLLKFESENDKFNVLDCTCPYVKKIHNIVQDNTDENTLAIIIGDAQHPEVRGICSYCQGDYVVCRNEKELSNVKIANKKVIMVSQTTQKMSEWRKCQNFINRVYTNSIIFDTICSVTEIRQNEADEMSKAVDLMIVIGGRNSSNTAKLYATAKQHLDKTYLVEEACELPLDELKPQITVGITAGASTPDSIIQEVRKTMEEMLTNTEISSEDFAGMIERSLKTLNTGETVTGIITSISSSEIHVDLGAKSTGIIPLSELSDTADVIQSKYKVGDEIEAIVMKVSDVDGITTLSRRKIENIINWRNLATAYENGDVITGKISDVVKGGLIIMLFGLRVFVPASQSGLAKDADLSTLIGTEQNVKIIELNEQNHRAVASVKAVLREERKKKEAEFWDAIEEGKVYTGVVRSLTSYGAFVDLGGVDGMVHSSELSWRRIKHPSEVVSVGEEITVFVKAFDKETKRISLGYKTEATNPWNIFTSTYTIGDVANVKIVSIMPFGAFAEVVPGADGLIHISQVSKERVTNLADVLSVGQTVDAKIIDINYDDHKISLSIRALLEDEDDVASDSTEDANDVENADAE